MTKTNPQTKSLTADAPMLFGVTGTLEIEAKISDAVSTIFNLPPKRRAELVALIARWHDEEAQMGHAPPVEPSVEADLSTGLPKDVDDETAIRILAWPGAKTAIATLGPMLAAAGAIQGRLVITDDAGRKDLRLFLAFARDDNDAFSRYEKLSESWTEMQESITLGLGFERK